MTRRARDQEAHNDICELIDNLPDDEKEEVLQMIGDRYFGEGSEDRRRRARDMDWKQRPGRDDLGVRGARRPGEDPDRAFDEATTAALRRAAAKYASEAADKIRRLAGDSAPRGRDSFAERYPDAGRIRVM